MATLARQPFAPLDGARLQSLTSVKNRQNALAPNAGKRKAESIDGDDLENVDPGLFSKRSKGSDGFLSSKDCFKPSSFILTKASAAPSLSKVTSSPSLASAPAPARPVSTPRTRTFIQPKSPAARLNTSLAAAAPSLSAPAGRSPTRGSKRIGILNNRRRTSGSPFTRVDPPVFGLGSGNASAAPFSLDAALKGTISSYASRSSASQLPSSSSSSLLGIGGGLYGQEVDSSWVFDIHEDTPEQEMTNLLQHSTCVLDISSDEESEQKARRERDEGRDKENIPPADDVSQTTSAARRRGEDEMVVEKTRGPLAEMNVADYYAPGCDDASVIIIPGDEDDIETVIDLDHHENEGEVSAPSAVAVAASIPEESYEVPPEASVGTGVEEIMGRRDAPAPKAALLEPIEGTGESFELWESASAKDEAEVAAPQSPRPAALDEEIAPAQAAAC